MHRFTVLSGDKKGTSVDLHGSLTVGRGSECDLIIDGNLISRKHATFKLENEKVLISDQSSNGTFVNGEKVAVRLLKKGDRIQIGETIIIYTEFEENILNSQNTGSTIDPLKNKSVLYKFKYLVDEKLIPSILGFTESHDFRFVAGCVFLVALVLGSILGVFPLIEDYRVDQIRQVAMQGLAISRHIREVNQNFLTEGTYSRMSLRSADEYPIVSESYIVNEKGVILSPASQINQSLEYPFVAKAREEFLTSSRLKKFVYRDLSDSKLGLVLPLFVSSVKTGIPTIAGYVVLVLNYSDVDINGTEFISLLLRASIFAALLGLVFLYILFQLYDLPMKNIRAHIDERLRGNEDSLHKKMDFRVNLDSMKFLVETVDSVLDKVVAGAGNQLEHSNANDGPKLLEGEFQVPEKFKSLFHFSNIPIIVLDTDRRVKLLNGAMEELTGMREASAMEGKIDQVVRDEGLGALILDLVAKTYNSFEEVKEVYPFPENEYPIYVIKHLDHFIVFVLKDEGGSG